MSIRKDEAQLIITIDAKESLAFQKTLETASKGLGDLKKLTVGSEEFNKTLTEQKRISDQLAKSDYAKLSQKQLTDRRTQLANLQKILPGVTFAEQGFERELKQVNTALAENARRVRAVGVEMQGQVRSTSIFKAALAGAFAGFTIQAALSRLKQWGLEVFNQIKRIDALNKAFKIIIPTTEGQARATEFLSRISRDYGLQITQLREQYLKYTAVAQSSNLALQDQEYIFESVAKAGSVLGLSIETQERALTALQQIMSKGTVQAEELKGQLGDALPGAVNIMAKALGVTNGQLQDMLKNGEVLAADALPKFARELQKTYNIDTVKRIDNINAAQNRFKNVFAELVTVIGDNSSGFITRAFNGLTKLGTAIKEYISPTKTATQVTQALQSEFNNEIEVLKRLSPENKQRKEIIEKINEKYKDYLPNLISEKDSLEDITAAQAAGNREFKKKLLYLALEEELTKENEKIKQGIKQEAGAELISVSREVQIQNLIKDGLTPGEAEAALAANKSFTKALVVGGKNLQDEGEKRKKSLIEVYNKLFAELGTTIDAEFAKYEEKERKLKTGGGSGGGDTDTDTGKKESPRLDIGPILTQGAIRDAAIKEMQDRELAAYETFYLEGNVSEEEYQIEKNRITIAWLETRMSALRDYGAQETDEFKDLYNESLKLQKENLDARTKQYIDSFDGEFNEKELAFLKQYLSEEEYQLKILEQRIKWADIKLAELEKAGLKESAAYKKIQDGQVDDVIAAEKLKVDAIKRAEDQKSRAIKDGFQAVQDVFDLGADLLLEDEKARKKNASAIKAFQIAAVTTNGINEVAAIWKNAAEYYGPAAPVIGGIQTALAVGRTAFGISKIQKQKFSTGHLFRGRSHSQGGIDIRMPDGNIGEVEGGETLINKRSSAVFAPVLDYINRYNGYGKPLFESGVRFAPANTTPSLPGVNLGGAASASNAQAEGLMSAIGDLVRVLPTALSNVRANVVYSDITSAGDTLNTIRSIASYR